MTIATPTTPVVLLFGGQGSPSVFSQSAATTAEEDARLSRAGSILLSRCHAAFLEEIASLDATSQSLLAIDTRLFSSPQDLLRPPSEYHTHAVLQASTIYLIQLLHYLAEIQRAGEPLESFFDQILEVAGFCSGLLPAVVVARSRTLEEAVAAGTEGFRLAFWIACRSFFWSCKVEVVDVEAETTATSSGDLATWSLVIRGLSQAQVEERLRLFAAQRTAPWLMVAAVSASNVISISGPRAELQVFRSQLEPELATRFAHVHTCYHGGDRLGTVVEEVLDDLKRRTFSFPSCSAHTKPIRSTVDGGLYNPGDSNPSELPRWLAQHLLVHCTHWTRTTQEIGTVVAQVLNRQHAKGVKIISFGPGSDFLLADLQSRDARIDLLDLSPFKVSRASSWPQEHRDSIAIVGMGVNLPKGRGTEELWATLSLGLNAVQQIPESRLKLDVYYSEDVQQPRSMPIRHGAFLDDPFSFDNSFFNISPREAKSMDPQQRMLLHVAQDALENAGYVGDSTPSFQRASTGCYIGLATGDYTDNLQDDIDVFYSPGTLRAFHSGRISYVYKLSGPSMVTDTACSSSMVSIYQACRALQQGDCTAAIAGGVNLITSPDVSNSG